MELDDDDDGSTAATDPSSDDATTPSNSNDVDVLSLGTVAALTAAAYAAAPSFTARGVSRVVYPRGGRSARALLRDLLAPAASVVKVPPKKIWTTPRESYWPGVWARRRLYSPTVWLWNPSHGGVMKSTRATNARRAPSRLSSPLR